MVQSHLKPPRRISTEDAGWNLPEPGCYPDQPKPTIKTETDPHGKQPREPGAKLDAGKNRLGLVLGGFSLALQEVGKVGTYGAQKYSDNGWLSVPDGESRYMDALSEKMKVS